MSDVVATQSIGPGKPINPTNGNQVIVPGQSIDSDYRATVLDEASVYSNVRQKVSQFFGYAFVDKFTGGKRIGFQDWYDEQKAKWSANPQGKPFKLNFSDPKFRRMLADQLGLDVDQITDEAIDYLFGNGDGKLNDDDSLTPMEFIKRLEWWIPQFRARTELGGDTAVQTLKNKSFISVQEGDYKELENIPPADWAAMAKSKDPNFIAVMTAAYKAYMADTTKSNEQRQSAQKFFFSLGIGFDFMQQENTSWDGKIPDDIKPFVFFGYMTLFHIEMVKKDIDIPVSLFKEAKVRVDFYKGIFLDFIAGHSNANEPTLITHDLPSKFTAENIKKARNDREQRAQLQKSDTHAEPTS